MTRPNFCGAGISLLYIVTVVAMAYAIFVNDWISANEVAVTVPSTTRPESRAVLVEKGEYTGPATATFHMGIFSLEGSVRAESDEGERLLVSQHTSYQFCEGNSATVYTNEDRYCYLLSASQIGSVSSTGFGLTASIVGLILSLGFVTDFGFKSITHLCATMMFLQFFASTITVVSWYIIKTMINNDFGEAFPGFTAGVGNCFYIGTGICLLSLLGTASLTSIACTSKHIDIARHRQLIEEDEIEMADTVALEKKRHSMKLGEQDDVVATTYQL